MANRRKWNPSGSAMSTAPPWLPGGTGQGNAQATRDGSKYKISGSASGVNISDPMRTGDQAVRDRRELPLVHGSAAGLNLFEQPIDEGCLTLQQLRLRLCRRKPLGTINFRECADPARPFGPLEFEGVALRPGQIELAADSEDGDDFAAGLFVRAQIDVGIQPAPAVRLPR